MEDIYSLGEKWFKSVASSRALTRSSSGRPEVLCPNSLNSWECEGVARSTPIIIKYLSGGKGVECSKMEETYL